jgi:hypothetical protein
VWARDSSADGGLPSFLTFAQAGVTDQTIVRYLIEDPPNRTLAQSGAVTP